MAGQNGRDYFLFAEFFFSPLVSLYTKEKRAFAPWPLVQQPLFISAIPVKAHLGGAVF